MMCIGAAINSLNTLLSGIMIVIGSSIGFVSLIICGFYLYKITEEETDWDDL